MRAKARCPPNADGAAAESVRAARAAWASRASSVIVELMAGGGRASPCTEEKLTVRLRRYREPWSRVGDSAAGLIQVGEERRGGADTPRLTKAKTKAGKPRIAMGTNKEQK